jgi:short-subunit dehydrogenase
MSRAFAPVLAANGGGTLVNVLSSLSFHPLPTCATYSAAKAAAWSLTNSLRLELRSQRSLVCAVYAGLIDTHMVSHATGPKTSPRLAANLILDGVKADQEEIFVDDHSRRMKAFVSRDLELIYPDVEGRIQTAHPPQR